MSSYILMTGLEMYLKAIWNQERVNLIAHVFDKALRIKNGQSQSFLRLSKFQIV